MRPSTTRGYFDEVAGDWDDMRTGFFSERVREKAVERSGARAGQRAVDVGAGTGFVTEALIEAGLSVVAVDPSEAMLVEMKEKLGGAADVDYRVGSAEDLPLEDDSVDFAFANMALHHVESPSVAIAEMARVVTPGGRIVITDLDSHDVQFLVEEHHDRWMGFERSVVEGWLADAGLRDVSVGSLDETCGATSECGTESAELTIFVAVATV